MGGRAGATAESIDPDANAEAELEAGGEDKEEGAAAVGEESGGDDGGPEAEAELES